MLSHQPIASGVVLRVPAGPGWRRRQAWRATALAAVAAVSMHLLVLAALPEPGRQRTEAAMPLLQARLLPLAPVGSIRAEAFPDGRVPVASRSGPEGSEAQTALVAAADGTGPATGPEATAKGPAWPSEPVAMARSVPQKRPGDRSPDRVSEPPALVEPPVEATPVPIQRDHAVAPLIEALQTAGPIDLDAAMAREPPSAGPAGPVPAQPPPAAPGPGSDPGVEPQPVYPTRIVPPTRLEFRMRRGMLRGEAVLDWRHGSAGGGAASYELSLDVLALGLNVMNQTSRGGFDKAGLAPVRFTDRRLRGSTRAANFQRQRGIVGFSGPSVEYPLHPGAQDRLSWMLQLPGIVSALPPGRRGPQVLRMQVFGARGDAAVWALREVGAEVVTTDAGKVNAVRWTRVLDEPDDTQVEIWLDPGLHHLPVKVLIGNPRDGDVLELIRQLP